MCEALIKAVGDGTGGEPSTKADGDGTGGESSDQEAMYLEILKCINK